MCPLRCRPSPRPPLAALAPLLPLLGAAAGCGVDEVIAPLGRVEEIAAGEAAVRVDTGARTVTLLRGDDALLTFPADALQLGTVAAVDDAVNYDPYRLHVPIALYTPPEITWRAVSSIAVEEATETAITLRLGYEGGLAAALTLEALGDGRARARLVPAEGAPVAFFRLRPRADAEEGFYGLGEYFDDVNHRGKVRAMQLELMAELESSYNEAHVPVPFLLGTRGWGLFVESPAPAAFAVATEASDVVEATFGTGVFSGEGLTFHLFAAAHPLDVTRLYYEVTGYPRLPARWALGPWIWRDEHEDQAQAESDLEIIRDLDLATTGYWIDRPYASGEGAFDFEAARFPDPQAMIDHAHALGMRMALWHTPYIDEEDPASAAVHAEAEQGGFYPPVSGLILNDWGRPIDLTNPEAYAFWQDHIRSYTDLGVEGFKLDYAEDVVPGLTADRNVWSFADGSDERTMHALYTRFYHQVYAETLPEDGGFLLCRAGTYGDQVNGPIIWPGDLDADFSRHGEPREDGDGGAVGGLPASVIAGLTLGPSGFPFYGSDTGGYRHSPPDKETFTRWFEQTALSTVMQIGTSSSNVAWEFSAETGFDEEMLGWYRDYTRLHLRLFPYEWSYATRLREDGRPIQRALGLAYPELGVHPSDIYLFGEHLLVAPVVERGAREREVILPPGRWIDWWTGEAHDGEQTITVDAPLDRLPLFLREGGIVPMLRPTIDTLAPTTDPARVDSYATTPGSLHPRIAAGAASMFQVFDGAEIGQELQGSALKLSYRPGEEFAQGAVFEVIALGARPAEVSLGGAALAEVADAAALEAAASGWFFGDGAGGTAWIKVGPGAADVEVALP